MIKLMQGDCLAHMAGLADGSIDLTVTSPPYDNLRTYNGNNALWGEHVWRAVIAELYRVTAKGGVVVWVVGDATIKGSETGTSFRQALHAMDCGFRLHDTMIYKKTGPGFTQKNRYYQYFEYMFVFSKGAPKTFHPIMVKKTGHAYYSVGTDKRGTKIKKTPPKTSHRPDGNVWIIQNMGKNATKDEHAYTHPAIFPEKLAHDHIISWSNQGDTVLDPFMGSGTTGKMAAQLGRKFVGIELDPEYFAIAEARIHGANG